MKFSLTLSLIGLTVINSFAQNTTENYFKLTRTGFNEKNALNTTGYVEQRWRLPGNKGFDGSI